MKLKKIALVMGAALAATSAHADIGTTDYAVHDVTLHLSSATALRDSISRMMARYCNPSVATPRNIYRWGTNNNYRAYECTFHTNATNAAVGPELTAKGMNGKRALVYHTVDVSPQLGGSIVGALPVYRGIPMEFVTANTDATCPVVGVDSITGFDLHNCPSTAAGKHAKRPKGGVSDTNPESFVTINLAGSDVVVNSAIPSLATAGLVNKWKSGLSTKELALGDSKPMFAVGFGIAATKFAKTSGLTNLDHSQVVSLLAGNVADWSQIVPTLSGPVKICRRTQGSGTQASFNAMFNSNPCLDPVGASQPVADGNTPGVIESSATSGVKTCLEAANTANEIAIGLLSLENNEIVIPNTATPTGWEFIALNGVNVFENPEVSTLDGVADRIREDRIAGGSYPYYQEATMQWLKVGVNGVCVDDPESAVANDAPHAAAAGLPFCHAGEIHLAPTSSNGNTGDVPTGDLLKLLELIRDNAGNPEITKNTVLTQNLPGVLSTPVWWTVPPYDVARFTPTELSQGISNYTRGGNFCKPSAYSP